MSNHTQQIFQTDNPSRWRRLKWSFRILLVIFLFFLAVLAFALIRGINPSIPNLEEKGREYANKLDPSQSFTFASKENRKYKGFKDFLVKKEKEDSLKKKSGKENLTKKNPYIRSAFYTAWRPNSDSYKSLEKNGDKLNTIFPEWFFIDTLTGKLNTRIDTAGLNLMKEYKLDVLPMLTNFNSKKSILDFDGSLAHPLLEDKNKRSLFIKQLTDTLSFYQLQGINIDFEELKEKNSSLLVDFIKDIKEAFSKKNLTVTIDVPPSNEDYDYKNIAEYADYIILMAYDQFAPPSAPGPISSQKWVEEALDKTAKEIPSEKIILGIAGFGYDWASDGNNKNVSYFDAINQAKIVNAQIDYDNDTYNLHYSYTEETKEKDGEITKVNHDVWFTDAATTFNILRFSDEYATAGTSLWVLGREDRRIWKFYDRDLSNDGLDAQPFDFNLLAYIPIIPDNVGYNGTGEVLDIIATPQRGKLNFEIDSTDRLIAEQNYIDLPSGYIIKRFAEDTLVGKGHKLILTFDDGPSAEYTPKILDILEKEKVPATFFIVGLQGESNIPILRRIYKDGYEIGNHTFTHNNIAKMSPERAQLEMKLTRLLIESITGRSTILFRAPYNADAEPRTYEELEPIARSRDENYLTINESIDPNDWQKGVSADSVYLRTITMVDDTARNASIILLHDAGGDSRQATVDALERIIQHCKEKGYVFTTVADLMGKTKNDVMPPLPPSSDGWLIKLNFFLAEFAYWSGHILFALFIIGIFLSVGRMVMMAVLAALQKRKEAGAVYSLPSNLPLVSIIVPAYNEEVNIVRTIESLLKQDYPNYDIIVVDDGSKDSTYQSVSEAFPNNLKVKTFTKPNGGKATALNYGINLSTAEFVVCIDADTQLKQDAVTELMKRFTSEDVGAVAGNVKVGNEINLLTKWQSIEYITAQNFDRRAFDLLNCITVVPGAIGAFRKQAIADAGYFTMDTLAEDCDLTMRMLRCDYIIRNCTSAISYTEAPESVSMFLKQRFRWSFGVMQCFWKHRDTTFNPKYKNYAMVSMPNILVFQMILPFLAPLADLILLSSIIIAALGIVQASVSHIVLYYLIFTLVDMAGAALAFAFEKENYKKLLWIIPQRFIYRQLMYYVLIKSFRKALKGELQGWGKLKRTGNVTAAGT
jgi:cellulose synthase/poly-beta-1,6-N-acetylglucosamine synthase-like glycosyltransferase/spore germination protein YaaH/peptidoglycan/xylan/chitin deacetylase (PgdA/CDA1 family)